MWETGCQAEAMLTVPGFKLHSTPKDQASCFDGQEHSTHVHPLASGALVHNAGGDGCDSLRRTKTQEHMLVWLDYNHVTNQEAKFHLYNHPLLGEREGEGERENARKERERTRAV